MAARRSAKAVNRAAEKGQEGGSGIYLDPDLVPLAKAEAERNAKVEPAGYPDAELDDDLAKARDAEAKRNDVEINSAYPEPTIDPELLKLREAEIKAAEKRERDLA